MTLDAFRGVVCLGVILLHLLSGAGGRYLKEVFAGWLPFAVTYLRLGVESFFVIGGFFWAYSVRPPESYLSVSWMMVRRLMRLAVPYWIAVVGAVAVYWSLNAFTGRPQEPPGWDDVWPVLVFSQNVLGRGGAVMFPLWSMAPLIQFYIAAALVFWLVRRVCLALRPESYSRLTERVMIAVIAVVVLGSGAALMVIPDSTWPLPRVAWAFGLGAFAYWWGRGIVPGWAALIACGWVLVCGFDSDQGLWQSKATVAVFVLVAISRGLRVPSGRLTRGLAGLGHRSYSMYLTHGLAGMGFIYVSNRLPPGNTAASLAYLAVALAASFAAGFWFYDAVERPTRRFADSIRYRG